MKKRKKRGAEDDRKCIAPRPAAALMHGLSPVLLELPISVVKGANLSCLQPSVDAMKMECMIANTPCDSALVGGC